MKLNKAIPGLAGGLICCFATLTLKQKLKIDDSDPNGTDLSFLGQSYFMSISDYWDSFQTDAL